MRSESRFAGLPCESPSTTEPCVTCCLAALCALAGGKHSPPQIEPGKYVPEKLDYFCVRPTPFGPPNRRNFLRDGTTGGRIVSKRNERPCDSVPMDRRCRVCGNPRYKMPCDGPLPETSEAEPSRSCSSPTSESTSTSTTRSGRIVLKPTRLAENDD